ncbi:MAG: hypothetical protein HYS98_07145 [Deltaproteobacteria bacterium]|nr:hypothetical protein [Deltaproteobacteria bacterium]
MKKGSLFIFGLFICISTYLVSRLYSEEESSSITVEDSLQRTLQFDEEPKKILSLASSCTEILTSLGLKDRLIEASEFKDFPTLYSRNREKYSLPKSRHSADVVFIEGKENYDFFKSELESRDWKVFVYHPSSLDDVFNSIEKISLIFGRQRVSKTVNQGIKAIANFIKEQSEPLKKPKIFIQTSLDPSKSAPTQGFVHDVINVLNGVHVTAAHEAEKVVIACPKDQFVSLKSEWNKMSGISAVAENKIYWIDSKTILEPSPRIAEAFVRLSKIFYYPQTLEH